MAAGYESGRWCDYYELLGVQEDTPLRDIERVYRQEQKRLGQGDTCGDGTTHRAILLNLARETLRHRREEFDRNRLERQPERAAATKGYSEPRASRTETREKEAAVDGQFSTSEMYPVLPCYLVIDTSSSMNLKGDAQRGQAGTVDSDRPAGESAINMLNETLPELVDMIRKADALSQEMLRVGVITFAGSAETVLPLSNLLTTELPHLRAYGSTNYTAAFDEAATAIPRDLHALGSGVPFYTPLVWFMSDGKPSTGPGQWRQSRRPLVQGPDGKPKYRAEIVAYGFGDADASTLREVATTQALMAKDAPTTEQVANVVRSIIGSIETTSQSLGDPAQEAGVQIEAPNDKFISLQVHTNE